MGYGKGVARSVMRGVLRGDSERGNSVRAEQDREGREKDISVAGEGGQREQGKKREGGRDVAGEIAQFYCLSIR